MEMTSLKRVTIAPTHGTSTAKDGKVYGGVYGGALGDARLVAGVYAPSLSQRLQISTGGSRYASLGGSLVRFRKAVKKVQMVARFRKAGEVHARFKVGRGKGREKGGEKGREDNRDSYTRTPLARACVCVDGLQYFSTRSAC